MIHKKLLLSWPGPGFFRRADLASVAQTSRLRLSQYLRTGVSRDFQALALDSHPCAKVRNSEEILLLKISNMCRSFISITLPPTSLVYSVRVLEKILFLNSFGGLRPP